MECAIIVNGPCHAKTCLMPCTNNKGADQPAQSDQHLCCLLLRQYDMYTCYIQSFKILASFCSWAGCFESYMVENLLRHIFVWCGSISQFLIMNIVSNVYKWATSWENLFMLYVNNKGTSAWSDQCLCCSLPRYNTSSLCIRNFKPLLSFCGCAGRFESYRACFW